jgi:Dockerin type I domain
MTRISWWRSRALAVYVLGLTTALHAAPLAAATGGDANGNGRVTVTDSVQILRAAADLPSVCVSLRCDVDGNGAITVTDSVLALRLAIGLAAAVACDVHACPVALEIAGTAGDLPLRLQTLAP